MEIFKSDSIIIAGLIFTGLTGHSTAIATETEKQKPNILLIVSDDLNTCIGPYMEIDRHTPYLDRLASEGVRFTKAYSQYPVCGPSRASFMSGLADKQPSILQGKSLAGYISGEKFKDQNSYAYTVSYEGQDATIRTNRWRYTRWGEEAGQGNEELYDHYNDPEEFVNLADNPDKINFLKEMREEFEAAKIKARMKAQATEK